MTTEIKYADKIAALLLKAESTTPEEAEALTAKAEEMMIKYGIEQAVIDARRGAGQKKEEIVTRKIFFAGVYAQGQMMMGHSVAMAFGSIRTMRTANVRRFNEDTKKYEKGEQLWLIGFESDVSQCELLIASLQLQCIVALDRWWKTEGKRGYYTAMEKFTERRSFIMSFGSGAGERIKETRRKVVAEETAKGTGTDLVLVNRKAAVDAFMDQAHPNLRSGRGVNRGYAGSTAGRAAGRNANVGGNAVGGGRKGLGR